LDGVAARHPPLCMADWRKSCGLMMTEKSPLTPTLSPPIFAAGRGDLEWRTQNDKNDL